MANRLSVFISFSGAGGVERMVMNLIREFARQGLNIDLLTIRASSEHLDDIPESVRVIPLKAKHAITSIPELARYMRRENPRAMLVAKDRAGRAALLARKLAGADTGIAIRLGTNLSTALAEKSGLQAWLRTAPMKLIYRLAEQVIAVSEGVAADTRKITGMPGKNITVIRNPVITPTLYAQAEAAAPHSWLTDKTQPIVMGMGRLTKQKDFATLVQAFAKVRQSLDARLIILGEGKLRNEILALAKKLDIENELLLPGFQTNPYAWLSRADLFVLSSRWEGSPNVLTEALALGIPSVATNCPSGPDETLQQGKVGALVPMGDVDQLAEAMLETLEHPPKSNFLQKAVADYNAQTSAERYLQILGVAISRN